MDKAEINIMENSLVCKLCHSAHPVKYLICYAFIFLALTMGQKMGIEELTEPGDYFSSDFYSCATEIKSIL